MSRESLLDRLLPVVYALLLHVAVASVLVFRLGDLSTPVIPGADVNPVEAVVIDEKQITEQL